MHSPVGLSASPLLAWCAHPLQVRRPALGEVGYLVHAHCQLVSESELEPRLSVPFLLQDVLLFVQVSTGRVAALAPFNVKMKEHM